MSFDVRYSSPLVSFLTKYSIFVFILQSDHIQRSKHMQVINSYQLLYFTIIQCFYNESLENDSFINGLVFMVESKLKVIILNAKLSLSA